MSDALSGPVGDLPDAWVEAASKAAYSSMTHDPQPWSDDSLERAIPRALAAALPLIRAHIADQIEVLRDALFAEYGNEEPSHRGEDWGYTRAARVARGGTDHE